MADEIEVRLPGASEQADADLARAAENVLEWNVRCLTNSIRPSIERGWSNLEGIVDEHYQLPSTKG